VAPILRRATPITFTFAERAKVSIGPIILGDISLNVHLAKALDRPQSGMGSCTEEPENIESQVWYLNPRTGEVYPKWVNADGCMCLFFLLPLIKF
jgi:hypothetical protein